MKHITLFRIAVLLLLALLSVIALYFGTFPLTKLTPFWGRAGYFDWSIFIDATKRFFETGILYDADLSRYSPNAEIYKFPPLFAAVLAICFQTGLVDESLRLTTAALQLLAYFTSILLCLRVAGARWSFFLAVSIFLFLATFEPFVDNYIGLQLEAWILLLLALCLWLLHKRNDFLAGAMIGLAAALKLYPVLFLLAAYLCSRPWRFLAGAGVSFLGSLLFSAWVIGVDQHIFYFSNIAPLLATESLYTSRQNASINNLFHYMGVASPVVAGWALLCGTLVWLWHYGKTLHPVERLPAGFAVLVAVTVLFLKNSWGSYQLLLVIPMMMVLAYLGREKFSFQAKWRLAALYLAGALLFYSPPHRLYFFSEWWLGAVEIPVVPIYIGMRSVAGLIVLWLALLLYRQQAQSFLQKR